MDYLERITKTGAYRFRRGIPLHLRQYFPDRGVVWREHLDTKSEAEARPRCLEVAAKVERLLQQAQDRHDAEQGIGAPEPPTFTIEGLTRLVANWKASERSRRAQFTMERPVMPGWADFLREAALNGICNQKPKTEGPEAYLERLDARQVQIDAVVRKLTQAHGLFIDQHHPAHAILSDLVGQAWIEVLEAEHRWRKLDFKDLPTDPAAHAAPVCPPAAASIVKFSKSQPRASAKSTPAVDDKNPPISEALEMWAKLGRPAHRSELEVRSAVRRFIELHGDLPIQTIEKHHARSLRDALAQLPNRMSAKQRAMPLPILLKTATGELLKPQTVNKTLNLLSGILSRAEREGFFDNRMWQNPFSVHLDVEDEDEQSYEPLSDKEVTALFESPVFRSGARPKQGRGDTAYWAPLLALYHGARRQDVLQLFVRDIRFDEEAKVHFIDINRDDGKKVKNSGSVRQFPLHPMLVKLGFLDWVARRSKQVGAGGSLWPGFEDRTKLDGRINRWGKWFGDYLAAHVVDHPRKKFHSLRGTFKRYGKKSYVPEPVLDRICGHQIGSVGGKYGRKKLDSGGRDTGYPLETLAMELSRVCFPGEQKLKFIASYTSPPVK